LGLTVLPHTAYSPDLAPSNFYLFPKLKEDLRGQKFSPDKVKAAVRQWFREKQKVFSRTGFKPCWRLARMYWSWRTSCGKVIMHSCKERLKVHLLFCFT
jgi:hypothetical protein